MSKKLLVFILVSLIGVLSLYAADRAPVKVKAYNLPIRGGVHDPEFTGPAIDLKPSRYTLDDRFEAGTTWYDVQHNGTCGKMISVDDVGMTHLVWMNGLNAQSNPRYVYYNVWDPALDDFMYGRIGIRIDASVRAGYISQCTSDDGFCFPAFHEQLTTYFHGAAAIDYCAYCEAFTVVEPAWCWVAGEEIQAIWPKIDIDINGNLHMVSCESPHDETRGIPQRMYYSRGVPEFDLDGFGLDINWDPMDCGGFALWDTIMTIAPDVACSRHTPRVAIAWCHSMEDITDMHTQYSQWDNEIYLQVSEDGGLNWGDVINVTQWTLWDRDCLNATGDTLLCDRDTMRAYTDCAVFFDEDDYIHIGFTTPAYWHWLPGEPDSGYITPDLSRIWHWSDETGYFSQVADGWFSAFGSGTGNWQHNVQRPNFAVDPVTDYLYCSYMKYDSSTTSEGGYEMADVIVTVSTNNGRYWAVGTNVTNTTPVEDPVPAGQSMNEREATLAKLVTNGQLHMEYVLDKDAGAFPQEEGIATLNQVFYHQIPVNEIATLPLVENYPMHWDSSHHPPLSASVFSHNLPEQFLLYQNYPNPFNPTTMMQFDLRRHSNVTLKIFNVLGQEVATLLHDAPLSAGVHQVEFDGSHLASGVYIYTLSSDGFAASKKMVLLK
ncbi:T9SS type A sorting domain-containing protein [bacterium]|nr:T9SS type A sorting domain-containing protein [bacterium]